MGRGSTDNTQAAAPLLSYFLLCPLSHSDSLYHWIRMWQEARKNEKKIRSLMVDHKKRVGRKKDFYERIRRDPVEFLQVHASALRIHIDSAISAAAENCLMPWRGDSSNMIDRFDARAHLEEMPDTNVPPPSSAARSSDSSVQLESRINYERWKNLVHYEFSGASENKVLHQIHEEERDVTALVHRQSVHQHRQQSHAIRKKVETKKAAIGYNYNSQVPVQKADESSSSDDSDVDPVREPLFVDLNGCSADKVLRINAIAQRYSIPSDDFVKFMDEDKSEAERIQLAKDIENEKSMFAGRKSRRERKALKERRMLIVRTTSAPNESEKPDAAGHGSESSSSESDQRDKRPGRTEFITSFGGSSGDESEKEPQSRHTAPVTTAESRNLRRDLNRNRDKLGDRNGKERTKAESPCERRSSHKSAGHRRRSRSRDRDRKKRRRSRSGERHRRKKSRSRSRSKSRERRRRRSRSASVDAFGRIRRATRSPSPTPAAKAFPSLPVQIGPTPRPVALPEPEVKREPSPPPVRSYYRRDLESGASASDSEPDEKKKGCEKSAVGETEAAAAPTDRIDNKVRRAGSSGSQASRIHKILMKKTRAQIESHYRKDKDREKHEKARHQERHVHDDSRRNSSSHRHRRNSSSSS